MKLFRSRALACSFCGRDESSVTKLVAGPRVYICDRCVVLAKDIMDGSDDPGRPHETRGVLRRIVTRLSGLNAPKRLAQSEA